MHLKIGLAAAVFAAVGTFAVAEGAGEGGCGDGKCLVGTDLHFDFDPRKPLDLPIPVAGHIETTSCARSAVDGCIFQSGLSASTSASTTSMNTGVYQISNEEWPEEEQYYARAGNCSGVAGKSGTNGCN